MKGLEGLSLSGVIYEPGQTTPHYVFSLHLLEYILLHFFNLDFLCV